MDKLERISRRRDQSILKPARCADEENLGGIVFLKLIRDGQSGNHVPAGATARQDRPHELTINQMRAKPGQTDHTD